MQGSSRARQRLRGGREPKQETPAPIITLSPDKVQLIGVRTAVAEARPLDKQHPHRRQSRSPMRRGWPS